MPTTGRCVIIVDNRQEGFCVHASGWGCGVGARRGRHFRGGQGLHGRGALAPLGQPLVAEIEIVSLQAGEDDSLSARLASPDAFEQAGIDINPVLNNVRISLERRDKRPFRG